MRVLGGEKAVTSTGHGEGCRASDGWTGASPTCKKGQNGLARDTEFGPFMERKSGAGDRDRTYLGSQSLQDTARPKPAECRMLAAQITTISRLWR